MFDTMTMTKLVGGFCGAFLIFLLGGFGAEFIYHEAESHDGEHHQAYSIETGGDDHGGESDEPEVPFAEVLAAADASEGPGVFRKCQSCHKVEDGANGTGPNLFGVVGRDVGSVGGFGYSGALSEAADVWTPENLNAFLTNPKGFAPGTSMSFSGLSSVEDRANLIAWLESNGG
ncbi:MAG: cytochrome c family protein [Silicimonas sp.]|jgi:cytochrome c|nr:cytochrome c family protein [Silicimonas sp.]